MTAPLVPSEDEPPTETFGTQAEAPNAPESPIQVEGLPPLDPPTLRAYELPTARRVVTYGLQLAYRSSGELRRASLYIGLLTLALLGPPVVYLIEFVAHYDVTDLQAISALVGDNAAGTAFLAVTTMLTVGLVAWLAVSIDGSLIAVALLAARETDRALTLREATTRARQVFWRMVRGSLIAGLVSLVIQAILAGVLSIFVEPSTGRGFVVSFVAIVLVAPLGYLATGVVIGDVGAVDALARSIHLARARPRIALVVALFTLVTAGIQTFALLAGLDLVARVGAFFQVGVTSGVGPLVLTILGLLLFVMAFGSLTFTVGALVAAPQVAAFLGLTYFAGGLDKARKLPPGAPRFRWMTRPMVGTVLIVAFFSGTGIASLQGVRPAGPDPIIQLLNANGPDGRIGILSRERVDVIDPIGDVAGPLNTPADIAEAEYAELAVVPGWVLTDVFDCRRANVACGDHGSPAADFDDGAMILRERIDAPFDSLTKAAVGEWGPVLALAGYDAAPPSSIRFPLATHVILTELYGGHIELRYYGWTNGLWTEYLTSARSSWIGDNLLTIVPFRTDILSSPILWDAYASYSPSTGEAPSQDTIRTDDGAMRTYSGFPPVLNFVDLVPSPKP